MSEAARWRSRSPGQTVELGRLLGRLVRPGDLVALCGPLGAGKTQLIKGLADGLGVPADEPVVSPTFVLVREYVGRLKLYHIDAYRLHAAEDLLALGFEEMLDDPRGVVALEWADRVVAALPAACWQIELAHAGKQTREVVVRAPDPERHAAAVREIAVIDRGPGR